MVYQLIQRHKKFICLTGFFLFFLPVYLHAACTDNGDGTFTCASVDVSDVQDCIDASSAGETIIIPSGSSTWTTVGGSPCLSISKSLIFQGAGIGNTIITDSTDGGFDDVCFYFDNIDNWRITGIEFDGSGAGVGGVIFPYNGSTGWRIDNCKFNMTGDQRAIQIGKATQSYPGLIDNCNFEDGSIVVHGNESTSWSTSYTWGSSNALFIEDCTFTFAAAQYGLISGHSGCNVVFRHNTVSEGGMNYHGACSSAHGGMCFEVYSNTFTDTKNVARFLTMRGGTCLVYDNTVASGYGSPTQIGLTNYRTCEGAGTTLCSVANGYDRCDGDSVLDGNEDATGYPCMEQVGRQANETLDPCYEWSNIHSVSGNIDFSVYSYGGCSSPAITDHIQENRDYYNNTQKPDYTPYTYPHPLRGEQSISISSQVISISSGSLTFN